MREGEPIGTAVLYDNPFHARHRNLKLSLSEYDCSAAAELFDLLAQAAGKPLKVMLGSEEADLAAFLKAGGFALKRRCFEAEVGPEDLLETPREVPALSVCTAGGAEYRECCRLLFSCYRVTHEAVSPLTADFDTFCERLPETALFIRREDGRLMHTAFVEGKEIAYIASETPDEAAPFALAAAEYLFSEHRRILFECDDCDPASMLLLDLFRHGEESFDTYVR